MRAYFHTRSLALSFSPRPLSTPLLFLHHHHQQGKVGEVGGKQCITCPAHGTAFSLEDGSVQGEWCPKLPNLPLVGKLGPGPAPLKTFASRVEEGTVEVEKLKKRKKI